MVLWQDADADVSGQSRVGKRESPCQRNAELGKPIRVSLTVRSKLELVIPPSLLQRQSFLVPSRAWRTRGTMQLERVRTVRG